MSRSIGAELRRQARLRGEATALCFPESGVNISFARCYDYAASGLASWPGSVTALRPSPSGPSVS